MKTYHVRSKSPARSFEFEGAHLFEVAARTDDGQSAHAIVAADEEWKARTLLMLVQETMKLRGQLVTFVVQQLPAPSRMEHLSPVSPICPHFADLMKRGAEAWRAEVERARRKS